MEWREKQRAGHLSGILRRRLQYEIASLVRSGGDAHPLQDLDPVPIVLGGVAREGVRRIQTLDRLAIVNIGSGVGVGVGHAGKTQPLRRAVQGVLGRRPTGPPPPAAATSRWV